MSDAKRPDRISRRHDATVLDDEGYALARKHQLLCSGKHAEVVGDRLRKWVDGSEPVRGAGIVRVRLRKQAKVDLRQAATDLEPHARVVPNTIYTGEPIWDGGGPAGPPTQPARRPRPPRAPSPDARSPRAAVLDTGISAHPWFTNRDWFADCGPDDAERMDVDLDFELDNQAGHGTFVTGLLLHRAPNAHVDPVRVLSSDGVCDELDLIKALRALRPRTSGPTDVVNLSLGAYTYDDRPSPLLLEALYALGPATAVVAAAGNLGTTRPFWPAAAKSVIAVGALTGQGAGRAEFSNHGWWVDACAPGQQLTSSFVWFNGPDDAADGTDDDLFLGYAEWSGTSFATAQVSGAVAAVSAKRGVDGGEAARVLLDPAKHSYVPDLGLAVLEPRRAR